MIKNQSVALEINHADGVFVKDGVVCPEQWFSQEIRPLFLLKEAYGGDKDWSLLDYLLSDNKSGKTWQRIAKWTYGLMETTFQQIPSYILCGYTGAALDVVMGTPVCRDKNVNRFCWTRLNNHLVLVVDYWHPANQYPDIMNYYGLMGIYQQALREQPKMN